MKHTVIISSYNRPKMIRQAIKSVLSNGDCEIFVCDDGSTEDVKSAVSEFKVEWINFGDVECDKLFRFPIGINMALERCTGDIIHYLPDDDMFVPDRFQTAEKAIKDGKTVCYGKLLYMRLDDSGWFGVEKIRYPTAVISPESPHPVTGLLDHSQVFHRNTIDTRWKAMGDAPDAKFFNEVSLKHRFHPINQYVTIKRLHKFNMLKINESKGGVKE